MLNTPITPRELASTYHRAHNLMRNIDGLQPQEAFDELLKYLFFKQVNEEQGPELTLSYCLSETGLFSEDHESVAGKIRGLFSEYLRSANSWSREIWRDGEFHLSDKALCSLYQLFQEVAFGRVPFDARSAAIKEFLPSGVRRGLGIYLTPDDVVRMMVEFVDPRPGARVHDPACGSGTFLIEVLKRWEKADVEGRAVWGADKNPRMLLLAELNIGHLANAAFHRRLADSLFGLDGVEEVGETWIQPNSLDVIFTNPPFGVLLDGATRDLSGFRTCRNPHGETRKKQHSEVVFIEQSLRLLRPGGTLAIVLPKSVLTNATFAQARSALDELGYIYAIATLPPETFQTTGTQATTVVLFARKYEEREDRTNKIRVGLAEVTNVGYDSTGRAREGSHLPLVAADLKKSLAKNSGVGACKLLPETPKGSTFSKLADLISGKARKSSGKTLRDVVEVARTGKTPSRASYSDNGVFVVKVGNLTGKGINWSPRDRNFISDEDGKIRAGAAELLLRENDIVLTSSAHSPVYIARKVDILTVVPPWLYGVASFVGEVMMLRPKQDEIDPFSLLAYLRLPETVEEIQRKVRGQTAHLHPDDLLSLPIPAVALKPSNNMQSLVNSLKREARLNDELNAIVHEQNRLMKEGV